MCVWASYSFVHRKKLEEGWRAGYTQSIFLRDHVKPERDREACSSSPTDPSITLELQNPSNGITEVIGFPDFLILRLWNCAEACREQRTSFLILTACWLWKWSRLSKRRRRKGSVYISYIHIQAEWAVCHEVSRLRKKGYCLRKEVFCVSFTFALFTNERRMNQFIYHIVLLRHFPEPGI